MKSIICHLEQFCVCVFSEVEHNNSESHNVNEYSFVVVERVHRLDIYGTASEWNGMEHLLVASH